MTTEEGPVTKIMFKSMPDFKFIAAYQAYSKSFDNAKDEEQRKALNEIVSKLYENKIGYSQFYSEVNRFIEGSERGGEFKRARIEGQRKRDYQRDERKKERSSRYKG